MGRVFGFERPVHSTVVVIPEGDFKAPWLNPSSSLPKAKGGVDATLVHVRQFVAMEHAVTNASLQGFLRAHPEWRRGQVSRP